MAEPLSALDWSLVQSFLAVAEAGSLSGAARILGLSQPSVGRQVQAMEAALGVALFTRQPRGMALTEAGSGLVAPARAMREAAGRLALAAAGADEGLKGTVRVTASHLVSHYHLPAILAAIRAAEPEIAIELVATDHSENLLFREADIAIRMYRPNQLDVVTKHLGDFTLGVYAARSYLARAGRPERLKDLRGHALVGYDRNEAILRGMRAFGIEATRDWFGLRSDDDPVTWELVRAGCGIGFAQVAVADRDPAVERLLPDLPLPPLPVWLTAPEAMRHTPRLRRVWELLEEGLRPLIR
jgi:DNA-binding transcriptional LysR family regulator